MTLVVSPSGAAVPNAVLGAGTYHIDTTFVVGQVRSRESTLTSRALRTSGGEMIALAIGGVVPATALIAAAATAVNIREAIATDGSGAGVVFGGFSTQLMLQLRGLVGDRAVLVGTPSIVVAPQDPSPNQRTVSILAVVTVADGKTITVDDVNRSISRAVANSIAVSLVDGTTMPTDGRPLFDRLMDNGGPLSRVYVGGRTSIVMIASPMPPRAPASASASTPCIAPAPELFYLRSTPSFAVSGPRIGAGTQIEFLHNTGLVQGANRLWHVRVVSSGATGYAVFASANSPDCSWLTGGETEVAVTTSAGVALLALLSVSACATVGYALRRHRRSRG